MRKVKLAMYVSLDGVVGRACVDGPFCSDELSKVQRDYLFSSDALLLGRVTYEGFAAAWPTTEGAGEFGERLRCSEEAARTRVDRGLAHLSELMEAHS